MQAKERNLFKVSERYFKSRVSFILEIPSYTWQCRRCITTLPLPSALPTCTHNTGFNPAYNILLTVTGEFGREVTGRTFKS